MGFLDSILGGQNRPGPDTGGANPLLGVLAGLLAQSGGLPGLLNKFTQAGHDDKVKSWISTGDNEPIAPDQVRNVVGQDQINAIAAKLGVDPAQASQLLAKFLPNMVDKLTPNGQVDPSADHSTNLAGLLPSLLQGFGGGNLSNIFGSGPTEEQASAG
ncbi:MAG TPA: YidB family protein [Chthoniobacterales bacterium]|nr:YidB family protein [Chthoniobacterales bacterium]